MVTIEIVINYTRVMGIPVTILPVLHCVRGDAFWFLVRSVLTLALALRYEALALMP